MLKKCFENVRKNCPLIHNITNYVTVNDCANVLIACGASPIMSDDQDEVAEIKTLASGSGTTKGVDADVADKVTEENLDDVVAFAKAFAKKTGAMIAITGAIADMLDLGKGSGPMNHAFLLKDIQ